MAKSVKKNKNTLIWDKPLKTIQDNEVKHLYSRNTLHTCSRGYNLSEVVAVISDSGSETCMYVTKNGYTEDSDEPYIVNKEAIIVCKADNLIYVETSKPCRVIDRNIYHTNPNIQYCLITYDHKGFETLVLFVDQYGYYSSERQIIEATTKKEIVFDNID